MTEKRATDAVGKTSDGDSSPTKKRPRIDQADDIPVMPVRKHFLKSQANWPKKAEGSFIEELSQCESNFIFAGINRVTANLVCFFFSRVLGPRLLRNQPNVAVMCGDLLHNKCLVSEGRQSLVGLFKVDD